LDAVVTGQQLLAIATAAVLTAGFELVLRGTLFGRSAWRQQPIRKWRPP